MRWAPVSGYEGIYEVSERGAVRRCALKPAHWHLSPVTAYPLPNGYWTVGLRRRGMKNKVNAYVHRLVGQAFVSNPDGLPEVNHKDGDKSNNHYSNLEWTTRSGNNLHMTRVLKAHRHKRFASLMAPWGEVIFIDNLSQFAEVAGCSPSAVSMLVNGIRTTCVGFRVATHTEIFTEIEEAWREDRMDAARRRPPHFQTFLQAQEMAA